METVGGTLEMLARGLIRLLYGILFSFVVIFICRDVTVFCIFAVELRNTPEFFC